jgi:hypothetical protein
MARIALIVWGGVYTNGEQFEFFTYMYNGGILLT